MPLPPPQKPQAKTTKPVVKNSGTTPKTTAAPMPPLPKIVPDKDNLMILSQRMLKVMFLMGGALVLLVVVVIALVMTRPQPRYFAVTPSLKLIHLDALNRPEVPPEAVADWAVSTTMRALNFGFTNYRQVLIGVRDRFSSQAYNQLINSLVPTLHIVKKNNLEVVLTPVSAPELIQPGEINGRYAWLYQFKVIRSYEPSGLIATQHLIAQVTVEQVPATRNPRQLVIAQMVLKQDTSGS